MEVVVELIVELLVQFVTEVLIELGFKGLARSLRRRWVRLTIAIAAAFGAGFAWSTLVRPDDAPIAVTLVAVLQWVAVGVLRGRRVRGHALTTSRLVSLAAVGSAFAAGRWAGIA